VFFSKFPHRANFSFPSAFDPKTGALAIGQREFSTVVQSYADGVFRVAVEHSKLWGGNRCLVPLTPTEGASPLRLEAQEDFALRLFNPDAGETVLQTVPGQGFGVSGKSWMFQLEVQPNSRFYGMGEKNFSRMELSGIRTKFWNTDVWGDFHFAQWMDHAADPPYLSVPYLIVKQGDTFVGLLIHNPYPSFMETPGTDEERIFVEWQRTAPHIILGAEGGQPDLWIIYGPTLREVTRKLQKLVGVTPLPPTWALGYHQSRWGYAGHDDLLDLDEKFTEHKIPCDGLWLDIDYMRGFRVFTVSEELFPDGAKETARKLKKGKRKIVAILDPGVKREEGYSVYDEGVQKDLFCRNEEGGLFIGMVWPGETVFPDFSLEKVRKWWAGKVRQFARDGFDAAWLDMNDPSTGPVDPQGMLFNRGREPHAAHRNQYALGMQQASFDGFRAARPKERPFLLSRSGFIGTSRYAAVWTGDNLSTYHYLKMCIPTSLNLSLSGIPFNGPDVGGFGGDASDKLMMDWMKACFLFPFLRNHSVKDSRPQEPWAFSFSTNGVLRHYIRLRYKLLPYLYNLFIDQEEQGDPILRPLFYEFDAEAPPVRPDERTQPEDKWKKFLTTKSGSALDIETLTDQFMVGPSILQAPIVDEKERSRHVLLPGGHWLDARSGEWIHADHVRVSPERDETPLYIRNGAILPMQSGLPSDNTKDLLNVEIHLFAAPKTSGSSAILYRADDGRTYNYRNGERSAVRIEMDWTDQSLAIHWEPLEKGYGSIVPTFVIHAEVEEVSVNGAVAGLQGRMLALTGPPFRCREVGG
jgi:alpha-glucosidase